MHTAAQVRKCYFSYFYLADAVLQFESDDRSAAAIVINRVVRFGACKPRIYLSAAYVGDTNRLVHASIM
jgi:hypothetical protein